MAIRPLPFDPDRFRTAAAHYERGRVAYSPAVIRRLAQACALHRHHRVLDLGCGPAPLARAFAPRVAEVVAMDPSAEMLAEARALSEGVANIRFVQGSSYDLGPAQGRFFLVVMGRSFHWMDRVDTLRRLDAMVEPGGAVATLHDGWPAVPANAWREQWDEIRRRYETASPARGPDWVRHEAVLLDSPFSCLEKFSAIERRPVDMETLVTRAMSMSSTSPSRLGTRADELVAELRAALAEVREEVVETSALVGWRPRPEDA